MDESFAIVEFSCCMQSKEKLILSSCCFDISFFSFEFIKPAIRNRFSFLHRVPVTFVLSCWDLSSQAQNSSFVLPASRSGWFLSCWHTLDKRHILGIFDLETIMISVIGSVQSLGDTFAYILVLPAIRALQWSGPECKWMDRWIIKSYPPGQELRTVYPRREAAPSSNGFSGLLWIPWPGPMHLPRTEKEKKKIPSQLRSGIRHCRDLWSCKPVHSTWWENFSPADPLTLSGSWFPPESSTRGSLALRVYRHPPLSPLGWESSRRTFFSGRGLGLGLPETKLMSLGPELVGPSGLVRGLADSGSDQELVDMGSEELVDPGSGSFHSGTERVNLDRPPSFESCWRPPMLYILR